MPYLPTPTSYLHHSSLLLAAYPTDTRITTKYTLPPNASSSSKRLKTTATTTSPEPTTSKTPPATATLTLKTYHPASGITLKYRTNKAAEVARLVTSLGTLARGEVIASEESTIAIAGEKMDVDGGGGEGAGGAGSGVATPAAVEEVPKGGAVGGGGGGGGRGGKKAKGKGKR